MSAPDNEKGTIGFDDFLKLDIRVATIIEAEDHPNADKLLVLTIDLGGETRRIIAGLKGHYEPNELAGKSIVVVTNLEPRKMRGIESRGMLLAAVSDDQSAVTLLTTDRETTAGTRCS